MSSPTNLLVKPIRFNTGLNLILGRYSGDKTEHGINGIGKSSLVRLIDYLLISETAERRFLEPKYDFLRNEHHQVCLDLEIRGQEIRIRREFQENQHVFIRREGESEYSYRKDEAKRILGTLFFPTDSVRQLPGERYRSLMQFFLKDDLNTQRRVDPISFVTHGGANKQELFSLNLFLLGLPNNPLIIFGEKQALLKNKRKEQKTIIDQVENSTGKPLAELKTDLSARQKEIDTLQKSLGKFELTEDFRMVSETIADIANKIANLRKILEQTDHQISRFRKFTNSSREIIVADIAEQYELVQSSFGELVRRRLDEVIAFRESLVQARLVFHDKRIRELETLRKSSFDELMELEKQRSFLLRQIEEKNTNISMRDAFERFALKQVEFERIRHAVSDVANMDQELSQMEMQIEEARRDTFQAINSVEESIRSIQELFVEIIEKAIGLTTPGEREGAYLDITTLHGRRRNSIPVLIEVQIPRNDALGHARLSLVVYDLTVFFHSIDSEIPNPRFLIHDGVFHAIARRTVVRTLNYIFQRSQENPTFQYIVTFNEDEISATQTEQERDGRFEFDIDQVTILKLSDHPDHMLFKRQFL